MLLTGALTLRPLRLLLVLLVLLVPVTVLYLGRTLER